MLNARNRLFTHLNIIKSAGIRKEYRKNIEKLRKFCNESARNMIAIRRGHLNRQKLRKNWINRKHKLGIVRQISKKFEKMSRNCRKMPKNCRKYPKNAKKCRKNVEKCKEKQKRARKNVIKRKIDRKMRKNLDEIENL